MNNDITRRGAVAAMTGAAIPSAAVAQRENTVARTMSDEDAATLERVRVQEGLNRYVDALNHRDWEAYADCWVEDCAFAMINGNDDKPASDVISTPNAPHDVRAVGREAVMRLVSKYNTFPWLVQLPHGIVVELEGPTTAKARQTLVIMSQSHTMIGIAYDRLVKGQDGRWRFKQRDYRPCYYESAEAKGLTTRQLPDPNYRLRP